MRISDWSSDVCSSDLATLGIGMKPATLPVAAFGVGIGVDYSIYLWSVFSRHLEHGTSLREAYYEALRHTGKAVIFTSASLVLSVFTWLFRSEETTSELTSLIRTSYAIFYLYKKNT